MIKNTSTVFKFLVLATLLLVCCVACGNNNDRYINVVQKSCMDGYGEITYQQVLESRARDNNVLWYYLKEIPRYEKIFKDVDGNTIIGPFKKGHYVEASWFEEDKHKSFFFEIDENNNVILLGMPDSSDQAIIGGSSLMTAFYFGYDGEIK